MHNKSISTYITLAKMTNYDQVKNGGDMRNVLLMQPLKSRHQLNYPRMDVHAIRLLSSTLSFIGVLSFFIQV